jgi:hypothetical protein
MNSLVGAFDVVWVKNCLGYEKSCPKKALGSAFLSLFLKKHPLSEVVFHSKS